MIAFSSQAIADASAVRDRDGAATHRPAPPIPAPSRLPVDVLQRHASCACGGGCPRCQSSSQLQTKLAVSQPGDLHEQEADRVANAVMRPAPQFDALSSVTLAGALVQRQGADDSSVSSLAPDESNGEAMPDDGDAEPLGGNAACPVNAVFSSNVAGSGKANCQVPKGQSGASRLAQYIVHGAGTIPSGGLTIGEQFKSIDDPYSIFGKLKTVTSTTDSSGKFDDCYILASPETLPPDFVLKVSQNHLYNGQEISKNVITYSANGVGVRHCKRKPDSCDFSDVCRL